MVEPAVLPRKRATQALPRPNVIGAALERDTALHEDGLDAAVEALTIDSAVDDVFGSEGPRLGVFAGAALIGVPRFQRLLLLLCGAGKSGLALSAFLPLFAHEDYEPASCHEPHETWRVPDRVSVAFEWALCCGDEWILAQVGSAFFVGNAVGAALGGVLSDRFGRRPVVVVSGFLHGLCVLLSSAAPGWRTYLVLRFLCGAFNLAVVTSTYTLAVEWVPGRWCPSLSAFLFVCTAFGEFLLVFMAMVLAQHAASGWRTITAACGGTIFCAVALQYLALPESPRWLHANGRAREAAELLSSVAKQNAEGKFLWSPQCVPEHFTKTANALSSYGLYAPEVKPACGAAASLPAGSAASRGLLLQATLKVSTWAMALLWLAAAMSYYGVSLAGDVLGQGMTLYASALLSGFAEIPSALLAAWMLQRPRFGRRLSTTLFFSIASCSLVALPWIDDRFKAFFAISGKGFASAALDCLYVFTSEVFETGIRGAALGLCSMAARFGSMSAPQALVLLSSEEEAMLMFGVTSGIAALACHSLLPETQADPEPELHRSVKASGKSPKSVSEPDVRPYLYCRVDPETELEELVGPAG